MEYSDVIEAAIKAVIDCDEEKAIEAAKHALEQGMDPTNILSQGFSEGIKKMGDLFGRGEVFLPQLILSAEAMKKATTILEEAINSDVEKESKGKMVIATVEGDVHDIGKGIVITLLKTQGIEVVDLGRDVSVDKIIAKAEEIQADIIGTSALLSTTMPEQEKLEQELRNRNLRSKYATVIGGAPCTQRWADKIGADAYAEDAAEAVRVCLELLS